MDFGSCGDFKCLPALLVFEKGEGGARTNSYKLCNQSLIFHEKSLFNHDKI